MASLIIQITAGDQVNWKQETRNILFRNENVRFNVYCFFPANSEVSVEKSKPTCSFSDKYVAEAQSPSMSSSHPVGWF